MATTMGYGPRIAIGPWLLPAGSSLRRIGTVAILLLVAVWAAIPPIMSWQAPQRLAEVALAGARGPQCLRLVVANDVSGSMIQFATPRQSALAQFMSWAPANLRADDEVGVLDFAATSVWTRSPRVVSDPTPPGVGAPAGGSTELKPVLTLLATLPPTACRTAVMFLSDGQVADLPTVDRSRQALVTARIDDLTLLVPSSGIETPKSWNQAFPSAVGVVFDGSDADASAMTFAQQTARLTGQSLVRK